MTLRAPTADVRPFNPLLVVDPAEQYTTIISKIVNKISFINKISGVTRTSGKSSNYSKWWHTCQTWFYVKYLPFY
jgi:hypothetical protein